MQDYLQGNIDDTNDSLGRFEEMNFVNKEFYFDVHQIENMFDHYLDKNQIAMADQILSVGIKQHPDALSLQIKQAIILTEQGEYDKALTILHKGIRFETNSIEIYMTLAWLYLKKGDIKSALSAFNFVLNNAVEDREQCLFDMAYNLNGDGFYIQTIEILEKNIHSYINNKNLLFELAFAYDKEENIEKGIEAYIKLLDLDPFYENSWYNLGILYSKTEEFENAIKAYDYALAIDPYHPESVFNKGNALAHLDQFDKALDLYLDYCSLTGINVLSLQYIGECWEQINNPIMAIRFYELALTQSVIHPDVWYGLGTSNMNLLKFDIATDAFLKAIALFPENPDYWLALAKCYFETKNYPNSLDSIKKSIELEPDNTLAWIELFQLKSLISDRFNAIRFIEKALINFPSVGAVAYIAAHIYLTIGKDADLAFAYFKIGFKNQPEDYDLILAEFPDLLKVAAIKKFTSKKR